MSECKVCGGEIAFYTDGGRRIPIQVTCTCARAGDNEQTTECRTAQCPRCEAPVYFIRHNGGSVWLDDLGPPWPIHSCFKPDRTCYAAEVGDPAGGVIAFCCGWRYRSEYDLVTYSLAPLGQGRNDRTRICFGIKGRQSVFIHEGDLVCFFKNARAVYSHRNGVIGDIEFLSACRHCGTPYRDSEIRAHEAGHNQR